VSKAVCGVCDYACGAVSLQQLRFMFNSIQSLCCSGCDCGVRTVLGAVPRTAPNDGLHPR